MRLSLFDPAMAFIIDTPLEPDRVHEVLRQTLDMPPREWNMFFPTPQESYMGYGDSFSYDAEVYNSKGSAQSISAIGSLVRRDAMTEIKVEYSCDIGTLRYILPVHFTIGLFGTLAGIIWLFKNPEEFEAAFLALAIGSVFAGIPFIIRAIFHSKFRSVHERIMRALRYA